MTKLSCKALMESEKNNEGSGSTSRPSVHWGAEMEAGEKRATSWFGPGYMQTDSKCYLFIVGGRAQRTAAENCLSLIQVGHERASANLTSSQRGAVWDKTRPRCPLQYASLAFIDTLDTHTHTSRPAFPPHRWIEQKSISVGVRYKYQARCNKQTGHGQQCRMVSKHRVKEPESQSLNGKSGAEI